MTRPQPQPEPLAPREAECLACVAAQMIPASAEYGVPGADDPAIMADMVASPGRDFAGLRSLLAAIDEAAGGSLAALTHDRQAALLARLRAELPGGLAVVEAVVTRAYYRDARVLSSLGLEPRPPFPKGFEVEHVDLSLLDSVRRRGAIWRSA